VALQHAAGLVYEGKRPTLPRNEKRASALQPIRGLNIPRTTSSSNLRQPGTDLCDELNDELGRIPTPCTTDTKVDFTIHWESLSAELVQGTTHCRFTVRDVGQLHPGVQQGWDGTVQHELQG